MATQEVTNESAEERLKKRAEVSDVEVFDGDAPDGGEQVLPPKPEEEEVVIQEMSDKEEIPADVAQALEELPENFVPPAIINEYTEIYHYMRTVGATSNPKYGILAGPHLDAEVNTILDAGYRIVDVLAAGYSPEGDRILFIFGKAVDDESDEHQYTEMHFVKRVLGIGEGAITGFNADVWINYQIEMEGFRVFKTLLNGTPPEGIVMLWILVR